MSSQFFLAAFKLGRIKQLLKIISKKSRKQMQIFRFVEISYSDLYSISQFKYTTVLLLANWYASHWSWGCKKK